MDQSSYVRDNLQHAFFFFGSTVSDILFENNIIVSFSTISELVIQVWCWYGEGKSCPPVMRVLLSGVLMVVFFKIKKKYIYLQEDAEEDSFVQSQIFSST